MSHLRLLLCLRQTAFLQISRKKNTNDELIHTLYYACVDSLILQADIVIHPSNAQLSLPHIFIK